MAPKLSGDKPGQGSPLTRSTCPPVPPATPKTLSLARTSVRGAALRHFWIRGWFEKGILSFEDINTMYYLPVVQLAALACFRVKEERMTVNAEKERTRLLPALTYHQMVSNVWQLATGDVPELEETSALHGKKGKRKSKCTRPPHLPEPRTTKGTAK